MAFEIEHIHVGRAIEHRRLEMGITRTELGRRINVPQQHVKRILERDTMETKRLLVVCEALEFNFFELFCPSLKKTETLTNESESQPHSVSNEEENEDVEKVTVKESVDKTTELMLEIAQLKINSMETALDAAKNCIALYKQSVKDKERIMSMMEEKIQMLEEKIVQLSQVRHN